MSNVGKENSKSPPPRARLMGAVGAALLAAGVAVGVSGVAFAGSAPPAPPVSPATVAVVSGGRLDWRPARSGAQPLEVKAGDGATVLKNGTVRFKAGSGTYDLRSGAARVSYGGTIVLTYRGGEVTLRDPVATLGGKERPVLSAVVVPSGDAGGDRRAASAPGTPEPSSTPAGTPAPETEIGDLKTFGIPPAIAGYGVTWSEIPATLTAAGAGAFPADRFEGADLGALTVSLVHTGVPSQRDAEVNAAATTSDAADETTTPDPTETTSPAATDCPTTTPTDSTSPTPTGSTTPTGTPTTTPTGTTSPTDTPTPDPTATDCVTAPPGDGGGDGGGAAGTTGADGGDSLPKTGGAFVPMILTGAGLSAAGGGVMVAARRRTPHAHP